MLFTEANFLELIRSAEGTPYLYGGTDPFHGGADCSGLIFWAAQQCGVTLPRTTEAEWAGLPHYPNWQAAPVGSIVEFEVPDDGGSPPQHVGVVVGGGFMIDDPHTGAVVRQETIPNEPGAIWPIGYCLLPFVNEPTPPTPTPSIPKESNMIARNTKNGGIWGARSNGDVYTFKDAAGVMAPYLGPLPKYLTEWGIGTEAAPVTGIVDDGVGGFFLLADGGGASPNTYHVTADGQYAR